MWLIINDFIYENGNFFVWNLWFKSWWYVVGYVICKLILVCIINFLYVKIVI